jgi:hypothetical protein
VSLARGEERGDTGRGREGGWKRNNEQDEGTKIMEEKAKGSVKESR